MGMMCDDDDYDYEAENEAFNIIERRQGGFQTKREMAKHKLTDEDYRAMYLKVRDELAKLQQRPWVGLTDEEATKVYAETEEKVNEHWESGGTTMMFPFTLYKAIEAKLKEKNT